MLTKREIDKFQYSPNKEFLWDDEITGFGVRVYPTGRKIFVLRYTFEGKRHKEKIGAYGEWTPDQAARKARELRVMIDQGKDPFAQKTIGKTWAELAKEYIERHAIRKKSGWQDEYRIEKYITCEEDGWGALPIEKVTRGMVSKKHEKIGERSIYEANQFLAMVSKMWNMAIKWELIPESAPNPAKGVDRFKETSRERFVTQEEMPCLLEAIDAEPDIYARQAMWLYLFTGLRKNELLTLKWVDVDLKQGLISIKDTKAGRPHHLPLSSAAAQVLSSLPRQVNNPYVFCGELPGTHLVDLKSHWRRIRKTSGVMDVRLHDLRRTVASWMALGGASLQLIGKVLNHSNTRTTEIYARFQQTTVRDGLETLASKILEHRRGG